MELKGIAGEWRGMAWQFLVWSGGIELGLELPSSTGIGVAWREAEGGSEWRGVTPGNDLGVAKNCTIPRAIPLAWRGVTLSTCEELDRNGLIPKQSWERGMEWRYSPEEV